MRKSRTKYFRSISSADKGKRTGTSQSANVADLYSAVSRSSCTGGGLSRAEWRSAILYVIVEEKKRRTLAVVTIRVAAVSVVTVFLVVFVAVLTVTVSAILTPYSRRGEGTGLPTDDPGNESGRECHGAHGRNRGRGHDGHPCEESSREHGEGWVTCVEGNEERVGHHRGRCHGHHAHGRGQSQSAKRQKAVYGPTIEMLATLHDERSRVRCLASIFKRSSRPMRLLCISW